MYLTCFRCLFLILPLLLGGCVPSESMKKYLRLAESNRPELEEVLDHYKDDSLKLDAARHLIRQMTREKGIFLYNADYETFSQKMYDSMANTPIYLSTDTMVHKYLRSHTFTNIWDYYQDSIRSFQFETRYDLQHISADFLIENIDYAFKAWELPWARGISYEMFKEYILPYRYGNESLRSWRKYYWDYFEPVIKQLGNETDPLAASIAINEYIKKDFWGNKRLHDASRPRQSPIHLLKGLFAGRCEDQAGLGISTMRALGIPTAELIIPNWGKRPVGHSFTAIYNHQTDEWIDFHAGDINPGDNTTTGMPKAYLYGNWKDGDAENKLHYFEHLMDVTDWFTPTATINVNVPDSINETYVYLCTFDNTRWRPVMWAKSKDGMVRFEKMGSGMVYLPMYYKNDQLVPFGLPLSVGLAGDITPLSVSGKHREVTLFRKYTTDTATINQRMEDLEGGYFQVATKADFSDAKTVHSITDCNNYYPTQVSIPPVKGRYVRYMSPNVERNFKSGPAMLAFYSSERKMSGEFISSEPFLTRNLEAVFDDNLLTYVSLIPTNEEKLPRGLGGDFMVIKGDPAFTWVGMDLGEVHEIDAIAYCPQNDKNGIYPGNRYQLQYWDNNQWNYLPSQIASDYQLTYTDLPKGTLYWLSCLDEGKEERIFTLDEEGKQVWW